MNSVAAIPTVEAPHRGNPVLPFMGYTSKKQETEGKLRASTVLSGTAKDLSGRTARSSMRHLGNLLGNHSMWQAVNPVEAEGSDGNSVDGSATRYLPEKSNTIQNIS